ncbi:MAG: GNAT family N-acetyltransferase [Phycisphaerales bacterium]|jgi:ribosomal protein S18 acetylase RimI-like enzyme|nr:GNAT family N-acetyltransferase [Phycisphaerales bacterium]
MQIPYKKHLDAATMLLDCPANQAAQFLERLRNRPVPYSFWGDLDDGVILVTEGAGSVATFVPSTPTNATASSLIEVILEAKAEMGRRGIATAHAILEPLNSSSQTLLKAAGFNELATLSYMDLDKSAYERIPPHPSILLIESTHFTDEELCVMLSRTYVGSLDCPKILGTRNIADVLASHRGVGDHDPSHWFVIRKENTNAGVIFLNTVENSHAFELAYLGIFPEMRNQKVALSGLRNAITLAMNRGCDKISLAVDRDNTPAIQLYKKCNFRETANRIALFCPLS